MLELVPTHPPPPPYPQIGAVTILFFIGSLVVVLSAVVRQLPRVRRMPLDIRWTLIKLSVLLLVYMAGAIVRLYFTTRQVLSNYESPEAWYEGLSVITLPRGAPRRCGVG